VFLFIVRWCCDDERGARGHTSTRWFTDRSQAEATVAFAFQIDFDDNDLAICQTTSPKTSHCFSAHRRSVSFISNVIDVGWPCAAIIVMLPDERTRVALCAALTRSMSCSGGYAAVRFLNGKLSNMLDEQDKTVNEWKKQLHYEHNRDTSLKTSEPRLFSCVDKSMRRCSSCSQGTDIFVQVVLNINRTFQCESIIERLSSTVE
jgi:hypothetical protein